jgi:1-acyl-sn-glycerol-3-phosphate acyltransferase
MNTRSDDHPNMFVKHEGAALSDREMGVLIDKVRAVKDIGGLGSERFYRLLKRYFSLQLIGLENIPREPTMFVGNHCLLGLDGWLVMPALYYEAGRFARAMGDNIWLQFGAIGDRLIASGMIPADPRACAAMMEDGYDVLVFPGGAFESVKPAAEKYTLQWRERYGFVRMAAQHGYSITPFATVGPDDFYDHVIEGRELRDSPLGKLLTATGILPEDFRDDLLPPVPRGLFSTLIPKPQCCYLAFGEPVDVPNYRGKTVPQRVLRSVRTATQTGIESLIRDLLLLRAQQRQNQGWLRRLLAR